MSESNSAPELSTRWWLDARPESVKGRQLDNAIADFERAVKRCESLVGSDALRSVETAVSSIQAAVAKTVRECDRDADAGVVAALEQLAGLARERLLVLRTEFEEDLDEDGELVEASLLDAKRLRVLMRSLLNRSLPFAFAIEGETSHFVLDEELDAVALRTALMRATRAKKSTHGTASAQGGVLCLAVEGPRLVGLEKSIKSYLDAGQPLPFVDVRVLKAPPRDRTS